MSETPVDMGMQSAAPTGAAAPAPQSGTPPQQQQGPRAPDSRGHSPARDAREQQQVAGADRKVTIAGVEYDEKNVADALAERAQREVVKAGLPASPDQYEIKLPDGFKPPEGMTFVIDQNDLALAEARKAAHELGLDQAGFSRMLGIYAATKVKEHGIVNAAREAELTKLGSAAPARIEAIETWLAAKVGDKARTLISTLKAYPVASTVEALEGVIRAFSSQGGASVTQSGREGQEDAGKIPGYEKMNFTQKRAAQMAQAFGQSGKQGGDR